MSSRIWTERGCLFVALVLVVGFGVSAFFWRLPLSDTDKAEAAQCLVAWIVEDKTIPGSGEQYPDAKFIPGTKRFIVACDAIPSNVSLSDDPRVIRVSPKELQMAFDKANFEENAYIQIKLASETDRELVLEFQIATGMLGGHGYRFTYHRTILGLRASGEMLWVS
jgi:hypothetical protein